MVCKHKFHKTRGVTLIEVCIVGALLGVAMLVANVSIKIVNLILFQQERALVQSQAQSLLFQMSKDVRNANGIVGLTGEMLQVAVFDTRSGFSSNVFDPLNISTITYQYMAATNGIKKTIVYPKDGTGSVQTIVKNYLDNYVLPDDPATADTESMFSPHPLGAAAPYDSATITIRLGAKKSFRDSPRVYSTTTEMRDKLGGG